jgi:ectoine hydroxylase-related dioxygenase (phytanoyl-CoA dioxygenase family)
VLLDSDFAALDRDGFLVLEGILSEAELAAILAAVDERLEIARRDLTRRHGGTLHLEGLTDVGAPFDRAWNAPRMRAAIEHMLGPAYQIEASYRGPQPGFGAQSLHTDDLPIAPGDPYRVASAVVSLTDFTEDNGATRVVPGSHRAPLHDAPKEPDRRHVRERVLTARAGSALVFNGHLWHSGTRNVSDVRRDSLQLVFRRTRP